MGQFRATDEKAGLFASAGLKTDYRDENDQTALTGTKVK